MLKINQLKLNIKHSKDDLFKKLCKEVKTESNNIINYSIIKRSIDARKKPLIYYIYTVAFTVKDEVKFLKYNKNNSISKYSPTQYGFSNPNNLNITKNPLVVGCGPAGLFCAYQLALAGANPVLLDRGRDVDSRVKDVEEFWDNGKLLDDSNVLFGEGGAGTFSDGKLNTLINDKSGRNNYILELFVRFGAPENILYDNKPHIGTDILVDIVKNIRLEIIRLGGQVLFNTCVNDLVIENNSIKGVIVNNGEVLESDTVVLAIGHSARDTFRMIYDKKIDIEAKNFAVGFRVEHLQSIINESQYGDSNLNEILPPAAYKLTYNSGNGRGVYSFCMCPGGYVVNSSSQENRLSINGMSYSKRDGLNANSAIIVTVTGKDFDSEHPLAGMYFQEKIEGIAYELGNGKIPVQRYIDYKNNKVSNIDDFTYKPMIKGAYMGADLTNILSADIKKSFIDGMEHFGKIISGFNDDNIILSGVESRTSSPIRIVRNENYESNISGLYPCGEGAGYAGGIMSAAMDGLRTFEKIAERGINI